MNSIVVLLLAAVVACAYAQVSMPPVYAIRYPEYYQFSKQARYPRDVTWDKQVGDNGKVFGTLGGDEQGLFGKGGYQHQFFNDDRGKLQGQAYGTRVLGPDGGSTNFGGRLDWSDKNANAALDVTRTIGGRTGLTASGSGVWQLGKNTDLSAGGTLSQQLGHGRPDIGFQGLFQHRW